MDELKLIKQVQRAGDREAAEEMVRHYYDEIYRFVNRQVGGRDIALDLTQEIFISLLRTIGHYDVRRGTSFRTWLYRIATNKVIDWFRSKDYQTRQRIIDLDEFEPADPMDFTLDLDDSELLSEVLQLLGQQSAENQKIFRLHIFGDYTFSQISRMLDLSEGTIKTKYYRLVRLLKKELTEHE